MWPCVKDKAGVKKKMGGWMDGQADRQTILICNIQLQDIGGESLKERKNLLM